MEGKYSHVLPLGRISLNTGLPEASLQDLNDNLFVHNFKYPDQLLYAGTASLGERRRKLLAKKDKSQMTQQKETIRKAVCALLNSGGGIVLVESCDDNYNFSKDGIGQDLEEALRELIYNSTAKCYDYSQEGSYLMIFVKPWGMQETLPKLCTLETGLFIRNGSSTTMANAMVMVDLINKKTNGKGKRRRLSTVPADQARALQSLLAREYLCLDEKLELGESDHIEYKDYSTGNFLHEIKKVIKKYFSSFGNSGGGWFIIGVDDTRTVKGCGKGTDRSEIESVIREALNNMIYVHLEDCKSEDKFYTLTIKYVQDGNKNTGYVIFLEMKQFCCLGFKMHPQSWILDCNHDHCGGKHVQVKQLTAAEWVKIMTNQETEPSLESQFKRLNIKKRPPLSKPVYSKRGLESLQDLQNSLFGNIEIKVIIKPDKLYEDLKAEHHGFKELIQVLKNLHKDSGAVLFVSRSWAVDVGKNRNPNVVCDIFLLSPNHHPTLYSVFNTEVYDKDYEYSRTAAFALKQKLVDIGSYTEKLCVIPAVQYLTTEHGESSYSWPVVQYPDTYKLEDLDTVKELLLSLTVVILSFRNLLSDKVGMEYFNLLTMEQYRVLSDKLPNQITFVHGPPGTGKTVIALEMIKRLKNRYRCSTEDILYICENKPLRNYVRSFNICDAMTRVLFQREDVNPKHIVVDEAQNFRTDKGDWFKKAEEIVMQSDGELWVFLDYFQSYHQKPTGLPEWKRQNKHTLTKVVRSPIEIYNVFLEKMKQFASSSKDDFLKTQLRESECSHGIEGLCEIKSLPREDILDDIARCCEKYLSGGYSQGDIAILCSTEDAVNNCKEPLYKRIKEITRKSRVLVNQFINAEEIRQDAIIVDSIRRFSGLERFIVFAINPVSFPRNINRNLFIGAASRATGKLHVFYEEKN
ncbi:schlafen family member 11 isoform X2 [Dendropsophus ebraccatus]|uniref:schlafen family member 11 isoform X2 n=1 Tax=Dendropsophus ebraccatus TaxID=150705 RepID=UPI0038315192